MLSVLTYFDIDAIDKDQKEVALKFDVAANEVEEQIGRDLHTYMKTVREYLQKKN